MSEQTTSALPPVVDRQTWQDSPDGWPKSPTYSNWLDSPDAARLYGPVRS